MHELTTPLQASTYMDASNISFAPGLLPELSEGMVLSVALHPDQSIKSISPPECNSFDGARHELIGRPFGALLVDGCHIARNAIQAVCSHRRAASFDAKIASKYGVIHDVRWYSYWNDEDRSVVCTGQVVTRQNQANTTTRNIFSLLSRQLRAPLQSIQQSATSLSSSSLPSFAAEELEAVCRSTDKLLTLVERLVNVFDRDDRKEKVCITRVSLRELVMHSADALRRYASEKRVKIECSDGERLDVIGDEASLLQVVLNLLSNAIKFSPAGSTCTISTRRVGESIELCVTDEGPGLTLAEAESAFLPYERLGRNDGEGFGLGLSICKEIIEKQGGEIGVTSVKGQGSSFWFRLPLPGPIAVSHAATSSGAASAVA